MTNVDSLIRKSLVTTGAILTVWGIFLPWECYQDFIGLCLSGLHVNWGMVQYFNTIQLVLMAFTPAALYHTLTTDWQSREVWRAIVVVMIGGGFLFLALETKLFVDGGGLKFVIGSLVTVWATFRVGQYSKAVAIWIPLLLAIFAFYNLVKYFIPMSFGYLPGVLQWQGRTLLFLGSLSMLSVGLWWHRQSNEEAA